MPHRRGTQLDVGDLHRHAGGMADLRDLAERREGFVGFIAHVADVERSGQRRGFGNGNHFFRRRGMLRRVFQPGGDAECSRAHFVPEQLAHALDLLAGGGTK